VSLIGQLFLLGTGRKSFIFLGDRQDNSVESTRILIDMGSLSILLKDSY
jgi:hypothetical protein